MKYLSAAIVFVLCMSGCFFMGFIFAGLFGAIGGLISILVSITITPSIVNVIGVYSEHTK